MGRKELRDEIQERWSVYENAGQPIRRQDMEAADERASQGEPPRPSVPTPSGTRAATQGGTTPRLAPEDRDLLVRMDGALERALRERAK